VGTGTGGEIQLVQRLTARHKSAWLYFYDGSSASEVRVTATGRRIADLVKSLEAAAAKTRALSDTQPPERPPLKPE
jgi:hypothetical protein